MTRSQHSFGRLIIAPVLLLGAVCVALLLLETAVRLPGVERRIIASALYLQSTDLPIHRVSSDPFLHYELAPDTRFDSGSYTVTIDAFGARRPTHAKDKPQGTFRILCLGGSTMYGAGVDDEQTIPAFLEARLNASGTALGGAPRRFEAWNFGTSAYTLGQASHLARRKALELDADLVVVQHHNLGRRPFLGTFDARVAGEPPALDHLDLDFFLEQLPIPESVSIGLHRDALSRSALYRSLIAASARLLETHGDWHCDRCNEISADEARALWSGSESRGVPVVFVAIPADRGVRPEAIFPGLPVESFIDLYRPGRPQPFYEVHPPPAVLDEYAGMLADTLRERDLLTSHREGVAPLVRLPPKE
jgi:hypothetical protein